MTEPSVLPPPTDMSSWFCLNDIDRAASSLAIMQIAASIRTGR